MDKFSQWIKSQISGKWCGRYVTRDNSSKQADWTKNPRDVSGLKHNNRLMCHRGIVPQWKFQVGLNVKVDKT